MDALPVGGFVTIETIIGNMAMQRKKLELQDFLPYRLSVLANTVSSSIAAGYAERFGLSIAEWRVMAVLGNEPGLSAAEVAARTAMDKVAVSRAVTSLLKTRRLERRTAIGDRRRSMLRLSATGNEVYARVVPMALACEQHLLEPLSHRDRQQLDRLLRILQARAGLPLPARETR
jgi:DNA-binding MarR family transcriptional regulator